jgi:transcriptional regulator with XRE-family HTH domain
VRFARFVDRALASARERGMTDTEIEKATNVRASTFHRWRRGETAPTTDKVRQFCAGLGVPADEALAALGVGPRTETPPDPMDPDVAALLRKLADPATSEQTRAFIRQLLRTLAEMPEQPKTRKPRKAV